MPSIFIARVMPMALYGLALAVAAGVAAETPQTPGRYTMTPAEGGFVRLDTQSGAMALCAKQDDQWACRDMPDAQAAQRRDIERLEAENKALKDEIRRMEEVLGLGEPKPGESGPKAAERPKGKLELPTEQDLDKAFDYVQRMLKKFQERMRELEREHDKDGTQL